MRGTLSLVVLVASFGPVEALSVVKNTCRMPEFDTVARNVGSVGGRYVFFDRTRNESHTKTISETVIRDCRSIREIVVPFGQYDSTKKAPERIFLDAYSAPEIYSMKDIIQLIRDEGYEAFLGTARSPECACDPQVIANGAIDIE